MKLRTISIGFNLKLPIQESQLSKISNLIIDSKNEFEKNGYFVQTVRAVTQPWEQYYRSKPQVLKIVNRLEEFTHENDIDYFSVGTTTSPERIPLVYDILKSTTNGFCSVMVSDDKEIHFKNAREAAKIIKKLTGVEKFGFANLRFAALFNIKPDCPFFPASYHRGSTSLAVGTENSDLVYKSFSQAKKLEKAQKVLEKRLTDEYNKLEKIGERFCKKNKIRYKGIDVSIATSIEPNESVAYAFEKLGLGRFGDVGTLAIARMVTETLKKTKIKKCGYSGLMLPVCEDYGLAKRNDEGSYDLTNLLLYSAVCGTGLDTIPLPGNVSEKKLYALLLDIASLSIKVNKPLSARLMPFPGKKAREMTTYEFEYFVNTRTMKL
jgi:uncharacterized protein (UPF0210 family)